MTPMEHPPAAAALDEAQAMRPAASRGVLDPVSRASEILFGLIMVLTFTLSLAATEAGRADVLAVLIGMLGCNLAWAIIDAVMYLMGVAASAGWPSRPSRPSGKLKALLPEGPSSPTISRPQSCRL